LHFLSIRRWVEMDLPNPSLFLECCTSDFVNSVKCEKGLCSTKIY
jgi:hypothetical protein